MTTRMERELREYFSKRDRIECHGGRVNWRESRASGARRATDASRPLPEELVEAAFSWSRGRKNVEEEEDERLKLR